LNIINKSNKITKTLNWTLKQISLQMSEWTNAKGDEVCCETLLGK